MENQIDKACEVLALIETLKKNYEINPSDSGDPLIFSCVVGSDIIDDITPVVEGYFGLAFKAAGHSAFFKNLFDGFVKKIGGMRREQTVFRKKLSSSIDLYCAFWPWGSKPIKTSIRIGAICDSEEIEKEISLIINKYSDCALSA